MLFHAGVSLERIGQITLTIAIDVSGLIYTAGWRRYRRKLPARYGPLQLAAFIAGLMSVWVALASPLDGAADRLLSAHMIQHMLLFIAAPALLLLSDPLLPLLRGLPDSLRPAAVTPLLWHSLRRGLHALTHPLVTLLLSSVVFWGWHSPTFFQLALRVPAIHVLEHASFFAAGLLFWYPVVQPWPSQSRWPRGAMIPYLLIADLQNTLLAAVLTFSDRVLYPFYELHGSAAAALDDQVLAGVIMWVPMSLAYLVPAVLLTVRLLSPTNRNRDLARAPSDEPPVAAFPARANTIVSLDHAARRREIKLLNS